MLIVSEVTPFLKATGLVPAPVGLDQYDYNITKGYTTDLTDLPDSSGHRGVISLDGLFVPFSRNTSKSCLRYTYGVQYPTTITTHFRPDGSFISNVGEVQSYRFIRNYKYIPLLGDYNDLGYSRFSLISDLTTNKDNVKSAMNQEIYIDNTSNIDGFAIRAPMVLIGYDGRSGSNFPGMSGLNDPIHYKVGPLDARWDDMRRIWRIMPPLWGAKLPKEYLNFPYLIESGIQHNQHYNKRMESLFNPNNSGCTYFRTHTGYEIPLRYNHKTHLFKLTYDSGCDWRSNNIILHSNNGRTHTVKAHLTMFTRTINSLSAAYARLNIYTVTNSIDSGIYDVYYDSLLPWQNRNHNVITLINGDSNWKGDGRLPVFENQTMTCGSYEIDPIYAMNDYKRVFNGSGGFGSHVNYSGLEYYIDSSREYILKPYTTGVNSNILFKADPNIPVTVPQTGSMINLSSRMYGYFDCTTETINVTYRLICALSGITDLNFSHPLSGGFPWRYTGEVVVPQCYPTGFNVPNTTRYIEFEVAELNEAALY